MARANAHLIHHHPHPGYVYPIHLRQRIYAVLILPLVVMLVTFIILGGNHQESGGHISVFELLGGLSASLLRLTVAYAMAVIVALPMALAINKSRWSERILLPVFDVIQSVPVLAFFPVVVLFFVQQNFIEGAAVFIIFLSIVWNLVFSISGGLRLIPHDISDAAQIYGIRGLRYIRIILAPAVFPYFVTGSLLAWAEGWNILIVAEVLHTYLPGGSDKTDLFGIGSLMVHASADGHQSVFVASILVMVASIALMNFFIWQRLLRYSERYRFE